MTAENQTEPEDGEAEKADVVKEADPQHVRMAEALLFAAVEPLDEGSLAVRMPEDADVPLVLTVLDEAYQGRGVNLAKVAGKWAFRTAQDLSHILKHEVQTPRRLSRAAVETLAIVAYHQPVTRGEIEEIRGVSISKGTLDLLIETGWVRLAGRRQTPGRPVTYRITDGFLEHFGLEDVKDLPGVRELKAAGLLDSMPPLTYGAPTDEVVEEEDEDDGESRELSDVVEAALFQEETIPEEEVAPEDESTPEAETDTAEDNGSDLDEER
jgi:segregation and condensation protein B